MCRGYGQTRLGDDGIYRVASRSRFVGAITVGFAPDGKRVCKLVTGKTKQAVKRQAQVLWLIAGLVRVL